MAIALIILIGLITDQLTKFLVLKKLSLSQSIPVIGNIFHITLVFNQGAAFGMLKGFTVVLIIISVATIFFIVKNLRNKTSRRIDLSTMALALIACGATGNCIDRLRFGYVVDFLDFRIWPVFNIADSFISIGAVLLTYVMLRHKKDAASHL